MASGRFRVTVAICSRTSYKRAIGHPPGMYRRRQPGDQCPHVALCDFVCHAQDDIGPDRTAGPTQAVLDLFQKLASDRGDVGEPCNVSTRCETIWPLFSLTVTTAKRGNMLPPRSKAETLFMSPRSWARRTASSVKVDKPILRSTSAAATA